MTENFTNAQWANILREADKHGCTLKITPAPSIRLPEAFISSDALKQFPSFHFANEHAPNQAKIIVTNDMEMVEEEMYAEDPHSLIISIDENTRYSDLIESISQLKTKDDSYQFESSTSDLWKNLFEKDGKNIVVKGSISPILAKQLETLFATPPFIWINGKKEIPKQKLTLITDTKNILPLANTTEKQYKEDDYWKALDKKYKNTEENEESKLSHDNQIAIYEEFKQSCQQLQRDTQVHFTYGQLRDMSAKIQAGMYSNPFKPYFRLHPDSKLQPAKKAWQRKRIKPFLSEVEHKRHNKITDELRYSPYIFITGPSGVGKSTYVLEQLGKEADKDVFVGLDKLVDWLKPTTPGKQSVLFIDEANLEREGKWNILEGLFNKTPGLFINKKFYPLSPNHKVIFAGNFNSFAGRHNHQFFDRHGSVFNFKELPDSSLKNKNIIPTLSKIPGLNAHDIEKITSIFLRIYHRLNNELPNHPVTARNLKMMAARFDLARIEHPADIETMAHLAALDEVRGLLNWSQKRDFKPWLDKLDLLDQQFSPQLENLTVTASRKPILRLLSNQLSLRSMGYDVSQLILEGPPGVGKSLAAVEQLKSQGFINGFDPNIKTLCPDTTKRYYHLTPTDPEKMTAILARAFHEGAVVIIDEFNTLVLERTLNQLLSGYDLDGKKAKKSGFFVIATQTPFHSLAGRFFQQLSKTAHAALMRLIIHPLN